MESGDYLEHDPTQELQIAGFIAKTFQILSDEEHSKTIFWSQSGKDFIIKDITKFEQVVLPKFFRHNKINSFVRQLNMYGFHKSRKEHTKSIFSHPNFQKDRPDLLRTIKRKIKSQRPNQYEFSHTPAKKIHFSEEKELATAVKQMEKKNENTYQQNHCKNFFDSHEFLQSRFNLNLNFSLKQVSMEELPELGAEREEDDLEQASIELDLEEKENPGWQNPSMFIGSIADIYRV